MFPFNFSFTINYHLYKLNYHRRLINHSIILSYLFADKFEECIILHIIILLL